MPPPQREPVCVRVLHCRQVIRATGCPKLEKKSGLKSTRPFSNRSEQTPLPKPFKDSKVYSPPALPEFTNSQKIFFYVAKLNKTLVHLAKILPQSLSLSPPLSFSLSLSPSLKPCERFYRQKYSRAMAKDNKWKKPAECRSASLPFPALAFSLCSGMA